MINFLKDFYKYTGRLCRLHVIKFQTISFLIIWGILWVQNINNIIITYLPNIHLEIHNLSMFLFQLFVMVVPRGWCETENRKLRNHKDIYQSYLFLYSKISKEKISMCDKGVWISHFKTMFLILGNWIWLELTVVQFIRFISLHSSDYTNVVVISSSTT